jgi:hypothetical protein
VSSPTNSTFLFHQPKIELKGRHSDITGVIQAEHQAVHFKNGRSIGNGACMQKGTTSRVMEASEPKLVFEQIKKPVPEIMGGSTTITHF